MTIAKRKIIKKYVGKLMCTTYHVSDNTPRGSRETSTGAKAKEYHTIAVDSRHPRFKMKSKLKIKGWGKGVVLDTGGFHKYGVDLDLFTPEGIGFKKKCKVWIYRLETKKEYKKRLQKEEREREQARKRRQKGWFKLVYNENLLPNQVITDPNFIKGGCISFGGQWFDVVKTKRGLGNKILIGMQIAEAFEMNVKLDMVEEGAVG